MISFKSKYFVAGLEYGIPIILVCAVATLIYVAFYSTYFQVTQIKCLQDFEACENPHLLAEIEKYKGENIFKLNPTHAIQHLTSGDYLIRGGTLSRQLPNQVTLNLQTVYPVIALKVAGTPTYATLDSGFRVIKFVNTYPNVPVVEFPSPITLTLAQPIADEKILILLKNALTISQAIPGTNTIGINGQDFSISLADGPRALLTSQRDITLQINALRSVLSDATITEGVAIIDVRFSQPVLRSQ